MMWRAITHNLGWKIASLLMAVLLWFAIVVGPDLVTTHPVPIVYKNLPAGLIVSGDLPDSIHVELRGPSEKLTSASLADVVALLDLSDVGGPGERTFTLSDSNLNLPEGTAFLRAVPSQLRLTVARLAEKDVPVEVRFSGGPAEGYRLAGQQANPETLRIAGSEERIAGIQKVQTDEIDLTGVTRSGQYRVNTFVSDPRVRLESPPIVTVNITVEKVGNTN